MQQDRSRPLVKLPPRPPYTRPTCEEECALFEETSPPRVKFPPFTAVFNTAATALEARKNMVISSKRDFPEDEARVEAEDLFDNVTRVCFPAPDLTETAPTVHQEEDLFTTTTRPVVRLPSAPCGIQAQTIASNARQAAAQPAPAAFPESIGRDDAQDSSTGVSRVCLPSTHVFNPKAPAFIPIKNSTLNPAALAFAPHEFDTKNSRFNPATSVFIPSNTNLDGSGWSIPGSSFTQGHATQSLPALAAPIDVDTPETLHVSVVVHHDEKQTLFTRAAFPEVETGQLGRAEQVNPFHDGATILRNARSAFPDLSIRTSRLGPSPEAIENLRQKNAIANFRDMGIAIHHFSYLGQPCLNKSGTRPATSLAIIASSPKLKQGYCAQMDDHRRFAMLFNASHRLDPVVFYGSRDILYTLSGTALENALIGQVAMAYSDNGWWESDRYGLDEDMPWTDPLDVDMYDFDATYFNATGRVGYLTRPGKLGQIDANILFSEDQLTPKQPARRPMVLIKSRLSNTVTLRQIVPAIEKVKTAILEGNRTRAIVALQILNKWQARRLQAINSISSSSVDQVNESALTETQELASEPNDEFPVTILDHAAVAPSDAEVATAAEEEASSDAETIETIEPELAPSPLKFRKISFSVDEKVDESLTISPLKVRKASGQTDSSSDESGSERNRSSSDSSTASAESGDSTPATSGSEGDTTESSGSYADYSSSSSSANNGIVAPYPSMNVHYPEWPRYASPLIAEPSSPPVRRLPKSPECYDLKSTFEQPESVRGDSRKIYTLKDTAPLAPTPSVREQNRPGVVTPKRVFPMSISVHSDILSTKKFRFEENQQPHQLSPIREESSDEAFSLHESMEIKNVGDIDLSGPETDKPIRSPINPVQRPLAHRLKRRATSSSLRAISEEQESFSPIEAGPVTPVGSPDAHESPDVSPIVPAQSIVSESDIVSQDEQFDPFVTPDSPGHGLVLEPQSDSASLGIPSPSVSPKGKQRDTTSVEDDIAPSSDSSDPVQRQASIAQLIELMSKATPEDFEGLDTPSSPDLSALPSPTPQAKGNFTERFPPGAWFGGKAVEAVESESDTEDDATPRPIARISADTDDEDTPRATILDTPAATPEPKTLRQQALGSPSSVASSTSQIGLAVPYHPQPIPASPAVSLINVDGTVVANSPPPALLGSVAEAYFIHDEPEDPTPTRSYIERVYTQFSGIQEAAADFGEYNTETLPPLSPVRFLPSLAVPATPTGLATSSISKVSITSSIASNPSVIRAFQEAKIKQQEQVQRSVRDVLFRRTERVFVLRSSSGLRQSSWGSVTTKLQK